MTHILITSGGTTVTIDPVRKISNSSSGRFGSSLATAALKAGLDVTYLTSRLSQSPYTETIDFNQSPDWITHENRLTQLNLFAEQTRKRYHEYRYQDFSDYAEQLKKLVTQQQPQIILLAAAVSDYLVDNYSAAKIRSSDSLTIQLKLAPKLIHHIREWSPKSFIVGCKLLVNASDAELMAAAKESIAQHDLDLCIANDLASIQRGAHEVILVARDGNSLPVKHDLGATVIAECLKRSGQ